LGRFFHLSRDTIKDLFDGMRALVMAVVIARLTSCMTSSSFLDHPVLRRDLSKDFWMMSKVVIHPRHSKLGALGTIRILASLMARFDGGIVLACLGNHFPWLRTFFVTLHVFATLLMTVMGLLKHVVHFLPSLGKMMPFTTLTVSVIVMIVMIMMIMVMVVLVVVVQTMAARKKIPHRWALVVAFVITWLASLVTSMHL
jgi:ABC-type uncharacterized transport system fused permease/ATPase subunit